MRMNLPSIILDLIAIKNKGQSLTLTLSLTLSKEPISEVFSFPS